MTEETEHALLSASASNRWLNCTASVLACKDLPDNAGEAAQKGTKVHELCAYKVLTQILGKEAKRPEYQYDAIDEENAQTYCDFVQSHVEKGSVVLVEKKVDYSNYTAPNSFGTADCIVINKNIMHVIDYKNGAMLVDAYKNSQLELYALGALKTFDLFTGEVEQIELSIIQPNRNNISTFEISRDDLIESAKMFKVKAEEAMSGGVYNCGAWCRWCRNIVKCRAHQEQFNDIIATFEKGDDCTSLTDEEINNILLKESALMDWLKKVDEYALNCAKVGKEWQGFKLSAKSNRKITDENSVANALKGVGIEPYETTTKLKALTNIEKELGKKKTEELIGKYITKVQGKESLVAIKN
jgi:hypothetical protein